MKTNQRIQNILNRREFLRLLSSGMLMVALPPLTGCGGGGGGSGGSTSGTPSSGTGTVAGLGIKGTPVTETERLATLDTIEAEFQSQLGTGTTFDPAAMVNFLKQQPYFDTVGYTDASGCAWASFTDGRKLLIINNVNLDSPTTPTPPKTTAVVTAAPAAKFTDATTRAVSYDDPLLTRDQFRLMNMWPGFPTKTFLHVTEGWVNYDTIPRIGRIAEGLGCTLVDQGDVALGAITHPRVCDVEGLKQVDGDGVFFLTGSAGYMDTPDGVLQGICTLTPAKLGGVLNTDYENDLDNGNLIYAMTPYWGAEGEEGSWQCLAITPNFARSYNWSFPDESLVFLNVTGGGLADWLSPLQYAGAGLILGWTGSPQPRTMLGAAQDFFELMFATNNISSSWYSISTEPRLRPYGLDEIYGYLNTQGLFYGSDSGGAIDRVEMINGIQGKFINQIRPSIEYLLIDEGRNEMQIQGQFGTLSGQVRLGSQTSNPSEPELSMVADPRLTGFNAMGINDWQAHLIRVDLTPGAIPAQAGGMVQVWLGNRYSNVAHLTRWRVTFQINRTVGSALHRSASIEVVFRAFVSGYRLNPEQPMNEQWRFVGIANTPQGQVGYSASGSLEKTEAGTTTIVTWSGAGNFGVNSATETFALGGVLWIPERRLDCTLGMSVQDGLHVVTETRSENGNSTVEGDHGFDVATGDPLPGSIYGPLQLYFDDNWVLAGGSQKYTDTKENVLGKNNCETTITWATVYPDYPPETDRGGR